MRDTLIGAVLAALFLGGIFWVSQMYPHSSAPRYVQNAEEIQSGYVGAKMIGPWQFVCVQGAAASGQQAAIPLMLNPNPKGGAAAQGSVGRCRTTLIYRRKGGGVLLVVSFRHAENGQKLMMIVRFPALAKQGDSLQLNIPQRKPLLLPVTQCGQGGCIAGGAIADNAKAAIVNSPRGALIFPAKKDGKPLGMLIPFTGLKDALAAMDRAEH